MLPLMNASTPYVATGTYTAPGRRMKQLMCLDGANFYVQERQQSKREALNELAKILGVNLKVIVNE